MLYYMIQVVCCDFNDRIQGSLVTALDFIRPCQHKTVTPMLLTCCIQWNTLVCYDLNGLPIQGSLVTALNFAVFYRVLVKLRSDQLCVSAGINLVPKRGVYDPPLYSLHLKTEAKRHPSAQ